MASVSSLDQDMRNLRMSRYTPAAANEARAWIESTLGRSLQSGDLLDALKDGVALCELANLVLGPPGIKYKQSSMPFIQMENISHFLTACEMQPLNLPAHDRFLTVDLFENKDPAQVLQCLGAFSRQARAIKPQIFRTSIGPKKTGQGMSPANTGGAPANGASRFDSGYKSSSSRPSATTSSTRAMSPSLTGGSQGSQTSTGGTVRSPGPVSSWSKKSDEGVTAPAWNIHQYGYLGGANQGSQGVSFGARRQITTAAPQVPSLVEKERIRKEKAEEEERAKHQAAREERDRLVRLKQEEEDAKAEEERRWEEETRRQREEERLQIEEQKRKWEEDERRWKQEEEMKRREAEKTVKPRPPEKPRVPSSSILRGQSLSQYQKEQAAMGQEGNEIAETPEQQRVRELERQLEEARERERQYQAEREERLRQSGDKATSRPGTAQSNTSAERPPSAGQSEVSWAGDEREYLRRAWQQTSRDGTPQKVGTARPLPIPKDGPTGPSLPSRPLPEPAPPDNRPAVAEAPTPAAEPSPSVPQSDGTYTPRERTANRTDNYLSSHAPPAEITPRISASNEAGDTSLEQQRDRDRRLASQQKTQAGGWASMSLLEREMEKERERQREWEERQQAVKNAPRDTSQGTGEGQSWDVNQYGFIGGDSQNRGSSTGSGIAFGGRRQIIGPRPQK